ncbi:MAG: flagellar basal body rod protein FlgB [Desulfobacterales bacterium]
MADMFIFDDTTRLLGKVMDVTTKRHALIAGNIANLDTVGYQPQDLDFKKTLESVMAEGRRKMATPNARHLPAAETVRSARWGVMEGEAGPGLDAVNIDREMTHLMENNIQYRSSVELLLRKIGMLRQAITEGGQ